MNLEFPGNLVNESGNVQEKEPFPYSQTLRSRSVEHDTRSYRVSHCRLQNYRSRGVEYPILYSEDSTMTDAKLLRPRVINFVMEW